jgi:hypothetical protein
MPLTDNHIDLQAHRPHWHPVNLTRLGVEGVLLLSISSKGSCRGPWNPLPKSIRQGIVARNDGRILGFVGSKEGAGYAGSALPLARPQECKFRGIATRQHFVLSGAKPPLLTIRYLLLVTLPLHDASLSCVLEITACWNEGASCNEGGHLRPRTIRILLEGIIGQLGEASGI